MTGCKIIDFCAQKLIEIVGIHSVEVECKVWHKSMYMYQCIYYILSRHHYIRLLYPCVSAFDKKLFVAMSAVCANSILMWTRPKLRHISSLINRSCFFLFYSFSSSFLSISLSSLLQTFLSFNPGDPHYLVSNSDDQVVFYRWVNLTSLTHLFNCII